MNSEPLLPARRYLRWQDSRKLSRTALPLALRDWLLDSGSLTRRLQQACPGRFRVVVLDQGWARPTLDEARVLGVPLHRRCLVREVHLYCGDQPVVFARTLIPPRTLSGRHRQLAHLGERPLGAYLFADPGMRRGPVQVAAITPGSRLHAHAMQGQPGNDIIWGRRSIFRLNDRPLLVSEIFLPAMSECL